MRNDDNCIDTGDFRVCYAGALRTEGVASCVGIALVSRQDPRLHGLAHVYVQTVGRPEGESLVAKLVAEYESQARQRGLPDDALVFLFGGNFTRITPLGKGDYFSVAEQGLDSVVKATLAMWGYSAGAFPWQARTGLPKLGAAVVDEMSIELTPNGTLRVLYAEQKELRDALSESSRLRTAEEAMEEGSRGKRKEAVVASTPRS